MKETRILMDMPVTVEIVDKGVKAADIDKIYQYFQHIDDTFSVFKTESEISRINRGEIKPSDYSEEMQTIFKLAEITKKETNGFFEIKRPDGSVDPSGLVKGWAIEQAAKQLSAQGWKNYYVDAGGDIQFSGLNSEKKKWQLGIRNPFKREEVVKIVEVSNQGVATSGTYIRGQHIYNPKKPGKKISDIISLTVIGPNIYEADRLATAAFSMGVEGIWMVEKWKKCEGYMIDALGKAIYTSGFNNYVAKT